jgi:hypothetical protein
LSSLGRLIEGPMGVFFSFFWARSAVFGRTAKLRGERPPRLPTVMVSIFTSNAFRRVYSSFGFCPLRYRRRCRNQLLMRNASKRLKVILAGRDVGGNSRDFRVPIACVLRDVLIYIINKVILTLL